MNNLEEYIQDVKSQLCCNQTKRVDYITYDYTEEQIDRNIKYFEKCMNNNLSGYKALLFFSDYINRTDIAYGQYQIVTQPEQTYATDWRHLQ